jgi:hypothetical protein
MVSIALQTLDNENLDTKEVYQECLKLIATVALLNEQLSIKWQDLCKQ